MIYEGVIGGVATMGFTLVPKAKKRRRNEKVKGLNEEERGQRRETEFARICIRRAILCACKTRREA